jgi:hypothetical protein
MGAFESSAFSSTAFSTGSTVVLPSLGGKTTFDGPNRLIIVSDTATSISVKVDIYSDWKDWMLLSDNTKYLPAVRTIGGDPVGNGLYAGDIYFLINGWRIQVNTSCTVDGVIYSDNYASPFVQTAGTILVTNRVSSLVNTVSTTGGTGSTLTAAEVRMEMDINSTKLLNINNKINSLGTPVQIASQIRTELSNELAQIMTSNNTGLTTTQATMLLEMYNLLGLDPTKPLVVTNNTRTAGDITQTITTSTSQTLVRRV